MRIEISLRALGNVNDSRRSMSAKGIRINYDVRDEFPSQVFTQEKTDRE